MTFSAWTAPLPVRAEIRMLCKHLPTRDQIGVGIITLTITTIVILLFWNTPSFLPDGLPYSYLSLGSRYDYVDGLEYCSSPSAHTITGPMRLPPYTCSWR
jgi:hypothetical protein